MIRTKREFYRLWRSGVLGNRPRTWATAADLRASGWTKPVVMRSTVVGWKTRYGISVDEALVLARQHGPGATFNECLPDEKLLIQGEVQRGLRGLDLTYSSVQKPMKIALAEETKRAHGIVAKTLLDHFLWPSSRDDVETLLDQFPDHVVEFSTYAIAIGDQPHRNTLIWEVRAY